MTLTRKDEEMEPTKAEEVNSPKDIEQRDDEGKENDSGYKEYVDDDEKDKAMDS